MLYKLLKEMLPHPYINEVVNLANDDIMSNKIRALGIKVYSLGMRPSRPNIFKIIKLIKMLRQKKPDIVQTWMYHADLVGGIAAKLAGNTPVIWGIRHSDFGPGDAKVTILIAKTCARLSNWLPKGILCCSEISRRIHIHLGYNASKMVVVPNGFDLDTFKPDPLACLALQRELKITNPSVMIGVVGRFHPMKGHNSFIKTVTHIIHKGYKCSFLFCGDNITWQNESLASWINEAGIAKTCHLLGLRDNMPSLLSALDIFVSPSDGEAFPNVVGEAMACGTPCIVTDVGDSAMIVGDTGKVVPPKNPEALSNAMIELIKLGTEKRQKLGIAARRRIYENFDLADIVAKYERLYEDVINKGVEYR